MNAASAQAGSSGEQADGRCGWWALAALAVGLAAITRQSLWIDEALTAIKATQPTLAGWWQQMLAERASDLQMPLYMIYEWGWARIFGVSEWALRAANLPWFVAGVSVFLGTFPARKKFFPACVTLACPFAWYYLDEARPYAMQFGASLIIFSSLRRLGSGDDSSARSEARWLGLFFFGVIALCGSSLLGMIWAGAACLSVPVILRRPRMEELGRRHRILCVCALGWLAAISAYYAWTLELGARASDVGKTDLRNVAFIGYELFGLSGLGPGRLTLRTDGVQALVPFVPAIGMLGVLVFDSALLGCVQLWRTQSRSRLAAMALVLAAPMAMILGAGLTAHFRVLGRHFMPLMPMVLFVLALGLEARWSREHWASKPLACGLVVLSVASCLSFRFAARHEKDDYRGAAVLANAALAAGQTVWWNAGREGALYYHVPLADETGRKGRALWLMNSAAETLAMLPAPDVVIVSKPDVYDGLGGCGDYLLRHGYIKLTTLPAFAVWERRGELAASTDAKRAEFD